jgi:drug/metabolite transporter (DMT)-like permease
MDRLYIALAGLSGGLVTALLGWLESGEPFNPRKFGGSVIRAMVAGVVFAVGYHIADTLSIMDFLYAFLGGAGVDVIGNRIAGKFGNGGFPMPLSKGGDSIPPQNPKEG